MTPQCQYTIVQCVPDPIADERINIGVLVFGDGFLLSRFLRRWDRVKRFTQPEDIAYLKEFADEVELAAFRATNVEQTTLPKWRAQSHNPTIWLPRYIDHWSNSIQFTSAQPSLEDPQALLDRLARQYLKEQESRNQTPRRTKEDVMKGALGTLRNVLKERVGSTDTDHLVKTRLKVTGQFRPQLTFDIAVQNGQLYAASQVISFDLHDRAELQKQADLVLWSMKDAREAHTSLDLSLIAAPPLVGTSRYSFGMEKYHEVRTACQKIEAHFFDESRTSAWADELATEVVSAAKSGRDIHL